MGSGTTPSHQPLLNLLLERILPAGTHNHDYFAGASALQLNQFVQEQLSASRHGLIQQLLPHAEQALNEHCQNQFQSDFIHCDTRQQNACIQALLEQPHRAFQAFFQQLIRLALEGLLSDPKHGGNHQQKGWRWMSYQHQEPPINDNESTA